MKWVCSQLRGVRYLAFAVAMVCAGTAGLGGADTARGAETAATASGLAFLHADGTALSRPDGTHVILKGCNLGNWLMIEPWMLGGIIEARDQAQIFRTLRSRFGEEKANQLIHQYRAGYITPRDFETIKSFGFNVVRVPFDYRLIQSDEAPYPLKPDAFEWLDHAVEMAESAGVYVILDLHGAPGGQSREMHTGEAGQNKLWNNAVDQDRTVAVYRAVAEHFRDRSTVAAYDLLNEPYGDFHTDLRPNLTALMQRMYKAVREVDSRHVVFLPGPLHGGIGFYGNPHDQGWHDVGFTEHYYAGLFGDNPVVESHARTLNRTFPEVEQSLLRLQVPYYVGEFNVVRQAAGGPRMMREYFDRMGAMGWSAAMWTYKLISSRGGGRGDSWGMVTNKTPCAKLDLQQSSFEALEGFVQSLATQPLAVNESLREALLSPHPEALPLRRYLEESASAPVEEASGRTTESLGNWTLRGASHAMPDSAGEGGARNAVVIDLATVTGETETEFSQDVPVQAGKRYQFTINASRTSGGHDGKVEIRIANPVTDLGRDHVLDLNSATFDLRNVAVSPKGTALAVAATAIRDTLRVSVFFRPSQGGRAMQGTIMFTHSSLKEVPDSSP